MAILLVSTFRHRGMEMEKFDICSDTIIRVAPGAKEVHLYSHGNTAILRSWASKTGIARLEKVSWRKLGGLDPSLTLNS